MIRVSAKNASSSPSHPWPALVLAALVMAVLVLVVLLLPAGCSTDTEEPSFDNPLDPAFGSGLPAPDSLVVLVGDNTVRLAWGLEEGEEADEYAVFRRRLGPEEEESERLLKKVTEQRFTDTRARNGNVYEYRVAAGLGGRFGTRSEPIEAAPGLFTFGLSGHAKLTKERQVSVDFSLPRAEAVRLSENPDLAGASWEPAAGSVTWTLEPGDGEKTVYASFRLADGTETLPVFDTIRLDTNAAIQSFTFDGSEVRRPGESIHFRISAGEPYGSAAVQLAEVFDSVPLFDNGTNGDTEANDGIYERTLTIPSATAVSNQVVRATFTDEAGNTATEVTAPRLLTIRRAPEGVALLDPVTAEPPDEPAVTVRWALSQETHFSAYRLFRSEVAPVDSTDRLVQSVTDKNTIEYQDTDVVEGKTYHYRVYVEDSFGQQTGSNTVQGTVPNLRPPSSCTLEDPAAVTTSRIALQWNRCDDRDFAAYRIHRNLTGAVTEDDPLVAEVTDADQTSWDDAGLDENTAYHYRIYTVDSGGLTARGNEVEGRTENEAPSPVNLQEPTAVSATTIALDWEASEEPDFRDYRIYRNTTGAVGQDDALVATIADPGRTYYDDGGRQENTRYYYRIYVTDVSGLFARSNEVEARTENEPPDPVTLNAAADVDSTSATLSWTESAAHDFAFYKLYRDEIPTVTTSSTMVVEMDDPAFTSFRDMELVTGTRYYYRVFVLDDADEPEAAGSNTISLVAE